MGCPLPKVVGVSKTVFLRLTSSKENMGKKMVDLKRLGIAVVGSMVVLSLFAIVVNIGIEAAFGQEKSAAAAANPEVMKWGFLAAAIAVGLGSIGAGIAVSSVGAAAMGALGEHPEMAARALIFVGLAEGIAIYGLIIAIMVLGKI